MTEQSTGRRAPRLVLGDVADRSVPRAAGPAGRRLPREGEKPPVRVLASTASCPGVLLGLMKTSVSVHLQQLIFF